MTSAHGSIVLVGRFRTKILTIVRAIRLMAVGGVMDRERVASGGGVQRVLVVDDHADTTEVLAVLFGLLGFETRCAMRGREALRAAREFDPELMLVDIGLPDITGFEVVHALRADRRFDDRCIVGVSGFSRPQDLARAKEMGFDEYFIKPIDLGKVRRMVRLAAARREARHGAPAAT